MQAHHTQAQSTSLAYVHTAGTGSIHSTTVQTDYQTGTVQTAAPDTLGYCRLTNFLPCTALKSKVVAVLPTQHNEMRTCKLSFYTHLNGSMAQS